VNDQLYFRQFLSGRDFALGDPVARGMRNLVYAIGDRVSGEAVLIDPAYDPAGLVSLVQADGLAVVGALATHYHQDHVGGTFEGMSLSGIAQLLDVVDVPIHVQRDEAPWVQLVTGVGEDSLVSHDDGDQIMVGDVAISLLHTPGHTPGSSCFVVDDHVVSGDTLFIDGCGRTDLPGSDPVAMYETLSQRLATLADSTVVYPGHLYSAEPFARMDEVRAYNVALAPMSQESWLRLFAA